MDNAWNAKSNHQSQLLFILKDNKVVPAIDSRFKNDERQKVFKANEPTVLCVIMNSSVTEYTFVLCSIMHVQYAALYFGSVLVCSLHKLLIICPCVI